MHYKEMKKIPFIVLLLFQYSFSFSQSQSGLQKAEDSLKILGKIIINSDTDFVKYNANEKFLSLLEKTLLSNNKSFDYPFDSLKTIARLTSDDKKFRILDWNLRKNDGTYEFFGFIQVWNRQENKYMLYPLKDNSDKIKKPEDQLLDNLNWFGAQYYKIIYNKYGRKKYYTLLGWHGNDNLTQKKIIDVLTFNSKDKPIFGASIFKYDKKVNKRIIFEYSATSSMSLKYEKQYMLHGKKKKKMIVFDRLAPLDPNLEGQYQFYYPETNIFDALIFRFGKWSYIKDVDARNAKESRKDKKHREQIIKEQQEHKDNGNK
jgi:hypothetical protein